ncbi:MAG: hypothetical protein HUU37_02605 [Bdellovibrionales bacterium]|nr:hypothetical protein [Bdellovibrionales bacterium]
MTRSARIILLLTSLTSFSAAAIECGPADPRLFPANPANFSKGETAATWELRVDFSVINDPTIELSERERARSLGTFHVDGREFPVEVSAKGKFRFEECSMRPLSVKILADTPFGKKGKKLRLTTVCYRETDWIEQAKRNLLKEYAVNRAVAELPGPHLATRLINLRLRTPEGELYLEAPAFLGESDKALASRCGMRVREEVVHKWSQEKRTFERFLRQSDGSLRPWDYEYDPEAETRMEFTNRLINNIDFLVEEDHNVIPLVPENAADRRIFLIPYDFDLSQAAGGTYYAFQGGAAENAKALAAWVGGAQRKEFLDAWPRMRSALESVPLDPQGKKEILEWFGIHARGLE